MYYVTFVRDILQTTEIDECFTETFFCRFFFFVFCVTQFAVSLYFLEVGNLVFGVVSHSRKSSPRFVNSCLLPFLRATPLQHSALWFTWGVTQKLITTWLMSTGLSSYIHTLRHLHQVSTTTPMWKWYSVKMRCISSTRCSSSKSTVKIFRLPSAYIGMGVKCTTSFDFKFSVHPFQGLCTSW